MRKYSKATLKYGEKIVRQNMRKLATLGDSRVVSSNNNSVQKYYFTADFLYLTRLVRLLLIFLNLQIIISHLKSS